MQKRLLDFLIKFHADHGVYPSTREIGKALGYTSPSTVHAMMHRLERARIDSDQTVSNEGHRDRGKLMYLFAETRPGVTYLDFIPA